jgi:selenocysteine lyase/cysteine desulfurase
VRSAFGQAFDVPCGYLNTPTMGVPPVVAAEAVADVVDRWRRGALSPADFEPAVAAARRAFADVVGVDVASVTTGGSLAQLVATIATGVPDGTSVLTARGEFTSLTFPFAAQAARGVSVHEVELAEVPARAAEHDLVAVSVVQSCDGAVLDTAALREAVAGSRTRVLLDATQSAGWHPADVGWADAVVAGGYKWLMAPRGVAWMSLRPELADELVPIAANWYAGEDPWACVYGMPLRLAADARRFDTSPAWFAHLGAGEVLPWLAGLDRDAVHAHCAGLADALREHLGLPATGSAIVAVPAAGASERLQRAGVVASLRAGAARVGFHLYNTADDLDRVVGALG